MKTSYCAVALLVCAINLLAILIGSGVPASVTTVAASNEPGDTSSSRGVAAAELRFPGEMEGVPQSF